MSGRLVFFGELLIRLTAPGNELLMQSPALSLHVGGAEANVAIGLAHLGHGCAMVSRVPANALGRGALAAVRGAGVDCRDVGEGPGRMGLYFLSVGAGLRASEIVYDRAGSSFAATGPEDYDFDRLLAGAGLLHLSGITPALGPRSAEAALAAARAAKRLGVPVERPTQGELASLGIAYLAARGAGLTVEEDFLERGRGEARVFTPQLDEAGRQRRMALWRAGVERAGGWARD